LLVHITKNRVGVILIQGNANFRMITVRSWASREAENAILPMACFSYLYRARLT